MKTSSFCLLFLCFLLYSESKPLNSKSDAEDQTETERADTENASVRSQCSYDYCIIIGVVSGLAGGLVCIGGAFIFWKCKKSSIMRCIFSAKLKDAREKKAQLQKQAENTHEELDGLSVLITQILELKKGHRQQKEEFKLLEDINQELTENKEKVQVVENEISKSEREKETDKTEKYLEEKQSLLTAQRKLEKRKKELENLHLSMEKQLQQTDDIMSRITERKKKVEQRLEVINLQLEEVESQSDMSHLHTE